MAANCYLVPQRMVSLGHCNWNDFVTSPTLSLFNSHSSWDLVFFFFPKTCLGVILAHLNIHFYVAKSPLSSVFCTTKLIPGIYLKEAADTHSSPLQVPGQLQSDEIATLIEVC